MLEYDQSKKIVWEAMRKAGEGLITQEQFNAEMERAKMPIDLRKMAAEINGNAKLFPELGKVARNVLKRFKLV